MAGSGSQEDPQVSSPVRKGHRLLTRRALFKAAGVAALAGVGSYAYGATVEAHRLVVEHLHVAIPGLAPRRHGVRLAQLSDFHAGRTSLKHIERALRTAMDLRPEFLLLTGDQMDLSLGHLPALCDLLRKATRKVPTYACTGNHDFAADNAPNAQTVCRALGDAGVHVLRNALDQPAPGPGELCFAGIEDLWFGRPDPGVLNSAPPDASIIVLSHNPDSYELLAPYRWHLMLSGHTHGGQVCAPFWGPLILPVRHRQHAAGAHHPDPRQPQRTLYVNRGIGHLLKVRFLCAPEVTCITLEAS